jgi:hypothetical protein
MYYDNDGLPCYENFPETLLHSRLRHIQEQSRNGRQQSLNNNYQERRPPQIRNPQRNNKR